MTVTIEDRKITPPPGGCGISHWREGAHLICHAATLDQIVSSVSNQLRAPIVDRTGLAGTYDTNVHFLPDERQLDADAGPVPSLPDAFRKELGLRLQKGKAPVEVLVIDHIAKPSEN